MYVRWLMKVGFVVAMENEYAPFLSKLGVLKKEENLCGLEFSLYSSGNHEIVLAKSGIGEIAAATATALLIGHYGCDYIVNYGLVGALGSLGEDSVVAIRDVVHYDADITAFGHALGASADLDLVYLPANDKVLSRLAERGIPAVRLASGDKFIANESLKNQIKSAFSADVCDMEGAGIALTATRAKIPFTMIKAVSDGAGEGAAESFAASKVRAFDLAVSLVLSAIRDLS